MGWGMGYSVISMLMSPTSTSVFHVTLKRETECGLRPTQNPGILFQLKYPCQVIRLMSTHIQH